MTQNKAIYKISIVSDISNGVDAPTQIPVSKDAEVIGFQELIDITMAFYLEHKGKVESILEIYDDGYYLLNSQISSQLIGFGTLEAEKLPEESDLKEQTEESI